LGGTIHFIKKKKKAIIRHFGKKSGNREKKRKEENRGRPERRWGHTAKREGGLVIVRIGTFCADRSSNYEKKKLNKAVLEPFSTTTIEEDMDLRKGDKKKGQG